MNGNNGQGGRVPFTKLCGLWEHESAKGSTYYVGRIGDAKIFVMANRDWTEGSNEPTHYLLSKHEPKERRDGQDRRPPHQQDRRQRDLGERDGGPPPCDADARW